MRKFLIFTFLIIAERIRAGLMRCENIFGLLFLPSLSGFRERVGQWKAWRAYEHAKRTCPAYRDFISKHPNARVRLNGLTPDMSAIPAMDKPNYINAYTIQQRCVGGKLPMRGAVIDESSGSTGEPNNWVRGPEERRHVARMLQISMHHMLGSKERLFINAFALGPWATGMCVSSAVVDVCLLKSTGPEISKIVKTLKKFGPDVEYIIAGYPPFLKMLVDSPDIDWSQYKITAFFGGEAISEAMRAYLMRAFRGGVFGDYGASDLEINIAAESEFTIAIRKLINDNPRVRHALNGKFEDSIPSVFQYNPMDYVIETNAEDELLITIARNSTVSPRIKYNIHDLGQVLSFDEIMSALEGAGVNTALLPKPLAELPVILMYGRSDFSVAYYGCKIVPSEVEGICYSTPQIASFVDCFCIVTSEDASNNKRLAICLELAQGKSAPSEEEHRVLRDLIYRRLTEVNQDFRESIRMVPAGFEPTIEFHAKGQGPFANNDIRVKCRYIQKR